MSNPIDAATSIAYELPFSPYTDDDDINEYYAAPNQMSQGLDDEEDEFNSPSKNTPNNESRKNKKIKAIKED